MSGFVRTIRLPEFPDRTGRGIRIAVVDTGIHAGHPHLGAVEPGIAFDHAGEPFQDVVDRLGHGTAVAAAIHEKAPEAALVPIKVFDRRLSTSGRALAAALHAKFVEIENASHGVVIQHAGRINALLEEHLTAAESRQS